MYFDDYATSVQCDETERMTDEEIAEYNEDGIGPDMPSEYGEDGWDDDADFQWDEDRFLDYDEDRFLDY